MGTLTTSVRFTKPTVGGDTGPLWANETNSDWDYADQALNQRVTIPVPDINVTLVADGSSSDQARYLTYVFTGALTATRTVTLPSNVKTGWAINATTGGHSITLTCGGGGTLSVPANSFAILFFADGSSVGALSTGFANLFSIGNLTVNGTAAIAGATSLGSLAIVSGSASIVGTNSSAGTVSFILQNSTGSQMMVVNNGGVIALPTTAGSASASAANLVIDGGTGVLSISTSSLRYKHSVEPYPTPLAAASRLRAIRFKSRVERDGDQWFAGFGAEEVHDAGLTEFVAYDLDGNPNGVQYGALTAVAIGAVNELSAIVRILTRRIEALEARP